MIERRTVESNVIPSLISWQRSRPAALVCASLLALAAGCGDSEDPGPTPTTTVASFEPSNLKVCQYDDFEVNITGGPSKGLSLTGKLILAQNGADSRVGGRYETDSGEVIPVLAAFYNDGRDFSLTLQHPDGFIMGLGPSGRPFCDAGEVTGVAIGPKIDAKNDIGASDTGDWLLSSGTLVSASDVQQLDSSGSTSLMPAGGDYTTNVTAKSCGEGGGTVVLKCGFLCLYTYNYCKGGDRNGEAVIY